MNKARFTVLDPEWIKGLGQGKSTVEHRPGFLSPKPGGTKGYPIFCCMRPLDHGLNS